MSRPTVESLRAEVLAVEAALDAGDYKPGPWGKMLGKARTLSAADRAQLSDDVSRVSDKLHRHNHPGAVIPALAGVVVELLLLVGGLALVHFGLEQATWWMVAIGGFFVMFSTQPLWKILVGVLLGVRYSYFHFHFYGEPRAKMKYGSYLAMSPGLRVFYHFCGIWGATAGFLSVGYATVGAMPSVGQIFIYIGWGSFLMNVTFIALGFSGNTWLQKYFSGGAMAREVIKQRKAEAKAAAAAAKAD